MWNTQDYPKILKRKTSLHNIINQYQSSLTTLQYLEDLTALKDQTILLEIFTDLSNLENIIIPLELQAMFKNPEDKMDAFVEINAGTGGTDSQDLAKDLERMYIRYAQQSDFECEILERLSEDVGIKQSILQIKGINVYGKLKNETGIHRFVRISPFNAAGKRQTSFVSVLVTPVVDDKIVITINPNDLKIDTYRSSGAGGQHVNKTDSAVRITHIPSGIIVACQDGRSQHQNKDRAMKMLFSKLYKKEQDLKKQAQNSINKDDISWGNQIRNYVFAPYKLVKDLRSGYETTQVDKIMEGNLDEMILSLIKK